MSEFGWATSRARRSSLFPAIPDPAILARRPTLHAQRQARLLVDCQRHDAETLGARATWRVRARARAALRTRLRAARLPAPLASSRGNGASAAAAVQCRAGPAPRATTPTVSAQPAAGCCRSVAGTPAGGCRAGFRPHRRRGPSALTGSPPACRKLRQSDRPLAVMQRIRGQQATCRESPGDRVNVQLGSLS